MPGKLRRFEGGRLVPSEMVLGYFMFFCLRKSRLIDSLFFPFAILMSFFDLFEVRFTFSESLLSCY